MEIPRSSQRGERGERRERERERRSGDEILSDCVIDERRHFSSLFCLISLSVCVFLNTKQDDSERKTKKLSISEGKKGREHEGGDGPIAFPSSLIDTHRQRPSHGSIDGRISRNDGLRVCTLGRKREKGGEEKNGEKSHPSSSSSLLFSLSLLSFFSRWCEPLGRKERQSVYVCLCPCVDKR
jgi:hypothetical protein